MTAPTAIYEADAAQALDPVAALIRCIEHEARALLFDRGTLPAAFFDLSTGVAGEVAQKLVNYGIRMAAVVPDLSACSRASASSRASPTRGGSSASSPPGRRPSAWLESA